VSDGSTFGIGGLSFACSRSDHPVETVAVRIEDESGRAVAYSADTGPAWSMAKLGAPIHLAICEASLKVEDEQSVQHLSGRQAGRLAREAGAERLVITHLPPGTDVEARRLEAEAEEAFAGPVAVALPGRRFTA
jgi:ribonuclease BN (tRNA processing enzyme)